MHLPTPNRVNVWAVASTSRLSVLSNCGIEYSGTPHKVPSAYHHTSMTQKGYVAEHSGALAKTASCSVKFVVAMMRTAAFVEVDNH